MLDFVTYTQRDFSEQTLKNIALNFGGDITPLAAGMLTFVAGLEYRGHNGSYRPDPIAASGETAGITASATAGEFDVMEYYVEFNIPVTDTFALDTALRSSDYSTVGSELTYKTSLLYRPLASVSLRSSFSTGFRAPGIGELYGGTAREDFIYLDPCADYTGALGAVNGGRDSAQSALIQSNCAALGVPVGLTQINPQLHASSGGNANLKAETSAAYTFGVVYSPNWVDRFGWIEAASLSIDYYSLEIDNAVQGRNPRETIDACINTLNPLFCSAVPRTSVGRVGLVTNQLQNIGTIDTSGFDIAFNYAPPATRFGQLLLAVNATNLNDYTETIKNADGSKTATELTGIHTNETFERAFPDWRVVTSLDWITDRWSGTMTLRWTDEMKTPAGAGVDSVLYADLQARYNPPVADDTLTFTVGLNNIFDEDPPVLDGSTIGMSTVVHDLPGRVGYIRVSYEFE